MLQTYVVQVLTGREKQVKHLIEKIVHRDLIEECFIPYFKLKKRMQGEWQLVEERITPGYLYVTTRDIDSVQQALWGVPSFTKLLGNDGGFIPLRKDEMQWLDKLTGAGDRTVDMSEGIIEGDQILITAGPLKGLEALIRKVDRHKRLAYIDMHMFGRTKTIRVGLEIVSKRDKQTVATGSG